MAHKVGSDIDAWCTRCRFDTIHVVVALGADGETARRVECKSCGGQHMYRPTKAEREARKQAKKAAKKASRKKATKKTTRGSRSRSKKTAEPPMNVREWSDKIAEFLTSGVTPRAYSIRETFAAGDFLEHAKFGRGVVVDLAGPRKIVVMFEGGIRTLAMGR